MAFLKDFIKISLSDLYSIFFCKKLQYLQIMLQPLHFTKGISVWDCFKQVSVGERAAIHKIGLGTNGWLWSTVYRIGVANTNINKPGTIRETNLLYVGGLQYHYASILFWKKFCKKPFQSYISPSFNKSGRRIVVRTKLCSYRHSSIFFKLPLSRISGTFQPL
jgi:hypothetical protein